MTDKERNDTILRLRAAMHVMAHGGEDESKRARVRTLEMLSDLLVEAMPPDEEVAHVG